MTKQTSHKHGLLMITSDPLWWQMVVVYLTSVVTIKGIYLFFSLTLCHNTSSSGTVLSMGD